ncbi:MAG: putative glycosyltransferase [Gemmatimonadetes bacterium]|nr:putative glycosyltransferase [Gemmatimonadota bacterium]
MGIAKSPPRPPARPFRLLAIGNFLSTAGRYRSAIEDITDRLEARGWIVRRASHEPARLPRLLDIATTAWRARGAVDLAIVDVFSGPGFLLAEAACAVLRVSRVPYVLILRGGGLPAYARRHPRRVGALLRSARAITVPSPYLAETMKEYGAPLTLVRNALELGSYAFRLRSHLEPRIVWLRAFHELYNPSLAPRILARLLDRFPHAHLTMIGPDKGDGSRQATEAVAAELGVLGSISFVNGLPKSDVPGALQDADILLNTTTVDNTPVSLLEGMASGLCVVTTSVGGIPYLFGDGRDARFFPSDDEVSGARAITELLEDRELALRISSGGRATAALHDWAVVLPEWERVLGSLIEGHAVR